MAGAERTDPYLSFRFLIEIDGLVVGGFSDVSGLQVEIDTEEYQEGGVNDHVHLLPKGAKYSKLILKKGITDSEVLWNWQTELIQGIIERKTVRIVLLDTQGNEKLRWRCVDAYPVRWIGPDLRADASNVAIETIELVHNGIKRI